MSYEPSPYLRSLALFAEEKHQPFRMPAVGETRGAALLVHGFPGTPRRHATAGRFPDECGLGRRCAAAAWVRPGDHHAATHRKHAEWSATVAHRLRALREEHRTVIVVAHSLGSAVSVVSSGSGLADGYALLAPYWRFGGSMSQLFWPVLRLFFGHWRPLARADFADERIRNGLLRVIPDLQLDDPAVQGELRAFTVPTQLLDELRALSIAAGRSAKRLAAPTLVMQGIRDMLVRSEHTSQLVARLPQVQRYETLDGSHNLTTPEDGAWERVEQGVLRFAESLSVR